MLGHALFRQYSSRDDLDVYATIRSAEGAGKWLTAKFRGKVKTGVDAMSIDSVANAIAAVKPDVLINCIGLKESTSGGEVHSLISINALLPHGLARLCRENAVRMIHISTDGVFDGKTTHLYGGDVNTYTLKLRITDDKSGTSTDTCTKKATWKRSELLSKNCTIKEIW